MSAYWYVAVPSELKKRVKVYCAERNIAILEFVQKAIIDAIERKKSTTSH